jgi:hypothetical protein
MVERKRNVAAEYSPDGTTGRLISVKPRCGCGGIAEVRKRVM